MLRLAGIVLLIALAAACNRAPEARQYQLTGQILAIELERSEVLIQHEDIKDFMPAMTMPFKVKDGALLSGKQPGDLVTATLVVGDVDAHLSTLTRTGHKPLDTAAPVSGAQKILAPGQPVQDALLVDQDGKPRPFSSFRGHRVALTFIYTRCPLVEFCPMMVRNFHTVQQLVKSTPQLADVRLITMTLDPEYDTPKVLKQYTDGRGVDTAVWSFVTGEPKDAAQFASQFGLYVERNPESAIDITHNLVTAVIDAEGRLAKLHTGNDWKPADLVADLKAAPAAAD